MADVTNYIDRLVAELCPDGVEYRPLGDVVEYAKKREKDGTGVHLYVGVENLKSDFLGCSPVNGSKGGIIFQKDDILLGNIRPYLKKMWLSNAEGVSSPDVLVLRIQENEEENIVAKYLYYILSSSKFVAYNISHSRGGKMPRGNKAKILEFEFPVPPTEIQEAIVEILDKFTNLEAELEARTLQYEYYRDSLFETLKDPVNGLPVIANLAKELCPNGVKYSTLKSVSLKTTNIKWERSEEAEYRYIDLSSVPTGGSSIGDTEIINSENAPSRARQIVHTDDILFGTTRPLLDRVVIVPEEYNQQICSTGYAVIRPDINVVIPSYIYHILREKNFSAYVEKNQSGAAYPAISLKSVMEYMIPLPPLEIQQRIVDILDRFDALTTSLSEGLPAELTARRSQYEYYRDQLLTFPRKGGN